MIKFGIYDDNEHSNEENPDLLDFSPQNRFSDLESNFLQSPEYDKLLEWGYVLSKNGISQLKSLPKDQPMRSTMENQIKENLFLACGKFQESTMMNPNPDHANGKLLETWADTLLTLSSYFNLPFFDVAIEKYEQALAILPESPKILRNYAISLSEQALFLKKTYIRGKGKTPEELLILSEQIFTKTLEIKPNSFKTLISWAHCLEGIYQTELVFLKACAISTEIGEKFKKAILIKPQKIWCLHYWGRHLDTLVTLFFSCRRLSLNITAFRSIMYDYLQFYQKFAQSHEIPLKPIMAFALQTDQYVSVLAHSILYTLSLGENENMRNEANVHLNFINTVMKSKQDARNIKINTTKEIFRVLETVPEPIKRIIIKSGITVSDVGEHHDLFINCLYFLTDKVNAKHPIFQRFHNTSHFPNVHTGKKFTEEELDNLWKKENPRTYYCDKIFIGKGGFGEVYIARRRKDKTRVAMKVIKKKLEEDMYHIVKEISVLRDCKHENIVNFEECYLFEGTISVVMEYCNGGTLKDLVNEVVLVEPEIAYFCRHILQGLEYLHLKLNRIHRDIKSDNILLNLNGDVKIADLGLVEQADIKYRKLSMVGTSYWMAPEIIAQHHYGMNVDIWALGCVCYELCVGLAPYRQLGALKAMFYNSVKGAPPLPAKRKFSALLNEFLDNCFQFDTQLRPSATKLLSHPFLTSTKPMDMKVIQNKLELVFIGSSLKMNGVL